MSEQRPDGACILVGESHGRYVLVAPREQLFEPGVRFLVFGDPHHGACPVDQEGAQVNIPALTDTKQGRLAAARVLPRDEPEEGRELPAVLEVSGIADRGDEGGFP